MTSGESRPISHPGRLLSGIPFLGGLVTSLVLGFAVGIFLLNRYVVFEIERGNGGQVVLVRTPLGTLPPQKWKEAPPTLWAATYPNSKWDEQNDFVFYGGPAGAEKKTGQLTVARMKTSASPQQVDQWYRERLGEDFTRTNGWFVARNVPPEWAQEVQSNSDPDAIVYGREMPRHVQGVVLQFRAAGVPVTLYDFQEGDR